MPAIDVQTLLIVAVLLHVATTMLVWTVWRHNPEETAAAAWAMSGMATLLGLLLLMTRPSLPTWPSILGHNIAIQIGFGLLVHGALRFERRPAPLWTIFGGAALFVTVCAIPAVGDDFDRRVLLASCLAIAHIGVFGAVLWSGRTHEPLPSRMPLVMLAIVAASTHAVRVVLTLVAPLEEYETSRGTWIGLLGVWLLVVSVAAAVLMALLVRERAEARHRRVSRLDPLTGALNRRAFVDEATARLVDRGAAALLLFDIDRFKRINDTWGHAAGDRVIRAFADLVAERVPDGTFGRWGGEEFALLIDGSDVGAAQRLAEEIRRVFAGTDLGLPDRTARATVSIGVSVTDFVGHELEPMLAAADAGLYAAKHGGRNRVVVRPTAVAEEPVSVPVAAMVAPCARFGL